MDVQRFARGLRRRLLSLCNALNTCRYVPEPARGITIPKGKGESRLLMLPSIKDRVVQGCVVDMLQPYWEAQFLDCSYAYRVGKGHHKALGRVEHLLHGGKVWVAKADIDDFFDSMHHSILLEQLRRSGTHPVVLHLVELWIKMGYVGRHGLEIQYSGIPQGALISPLLANIYLHPFDVALRLRGYEHVRYADDYVILCASQREAEEAYHYAARFLQAELKLRLNPEPTPIVHLHDGFVFLGMHFQGQTRRIAAEKMEKAKQKLMEIAQQMCQRPAQEMVEALNTTVRAWQYYYQRCTDQECFRQLDEALEEAVSWWAKAQRAPLSRTDRAALLRLERLAERTPRLRMEANRQLLADVTVLLPPRTASVPSHASKATPAATTTALEGRRRHYDRTVASSSALLVADSGTSLGVEGQFVRTRRDGSVLRKCHLKQLKHIVLMAERVSVSTDLLVRCAEHGIGLEVVDFTGRTVVRLASPVYGEPRIWEAQLAATQGQHGRELAVLFVRGKIENQLRLLKYLDKYWRRANPVLHRLFAEEVAKIADILRSLPRAHCTGLLESSLQQTLMGYEGQAAVSYWKLLAAYLPAALGFEGRAHQGATDPINQMLNYGYGILYGRVHGAVSAAGLNPHWGFLHTWQPKQPALVYDFAELFRPHAVDRVVLSLVARGTVPRLEGGRLAEETRRTLVTRVLERLACPIRYRGRRLPLEEVMRAQAEEVVAYLLGERRSFRPWLAPW